jgi:tetratricopeptide (TPR) repeat protein
MRAGDSRAALRNYQKALEIDQRLADNDRPSDEALLDLSISYDKHGDVQLELGDSQAALDSHKEALELNQVLA